MGIASLITFGTKEHPIKYRCDYCHRPKNRLYQVRFEENGQPFMLCPGNCITQAQANFNEKKEKGILPTIQEDVSGTTEIEEFSQEDNIDRDI